MKLSVFYDHIREAAEQTGKPLRQMLLEVRHMGIEAVEMRLSYLLKHKETLRLLADTKLVISCIYEFYKMDQKDEREKALCHVETAQSIGVGRILVVPGFLTEEESKILAECAADYKKTAAFLNENQRALRMAEGTAYISALGKEAGIAVTFEDYDDARSPISCVNGLRWFFSRIPDLSCTFDTGNFIIHGEDVSAAWEQLCEKTVHVHCKDRGAVAVAVGDGVIPVATVMEKLKVTGYDGYLAIEHFGASNQENCIRRSAAFLQKYAKLEEKSDD